LKKIFILFPIVLLLPINMISGISGTDVWAIDASAKYIVDLETTYNYNFYNATSFSDVTIANGDLSIAYTGSSDVGDISRMNFEVTSTDPIVAEEFLFGDDISYEKVVPETGYYDDGTWSGYFADTDDMKVGEDSKLGETFAYQDDSGFNTITRNYTIESESSFDLRIDGAEEEFDTYELTQLDLVIHFFHDGIDFIHTYSNLRISISQNSGILLQRSYTLTETLIERDGSETQNKVFDLRLTLRSMTSVSENPINSLNFYLLMISLISITYLNKRKTR